MTVVEIDAQLAIIRGQITAFYTNGAVSEYSKDDRSAKIDIIRLEAREKYLVRMKDRIQCGLIRRAVPLG